MAVAVRQRTGGSAGSGTAHPVALPDYVPGDFWVWFLYSRGTTGASTPAGWTRVDGRSAAASGSAPHLSVFARAPDGTEGTTATATLANSGGARSIVLALSGANTGVQFTNAGTNTTLVGGGRSAILNTNATAGPTLPSFDSSVAGSMLLDAWCGVAGSGGTFTTRGDLTLEQVSGIGTGTNYISYGLASGQQAAAGPTGDFPITSDVAVRWVHTAITIAPAASAAPTVDGSGTGTATTGAAAAGSTVVQGSGTGAASTAAAVAPLVVVMGAGRGDATASAVGSGLVVVRGAGRGDANSDAVGQVGASQVIAGGKGSAVASGIGAGTVLVQGVPAPASVTSSASAAGRVLVTGAGTGAATSSAAGAGTVRVAGAGTGEATAEGTADGVVIDQRPAIDLDIRVELASPSARVAFDPARPWRARLED